jgi:3-hydroxyacyl-CoA dehydrogenase
MLQMSSIRSVAILGAGTMGAQIAAHFANAGAYCSCSTSRPSSRATD